MQAQTARASDKSHSLLRADLQKLKEEHLHVNLQKQLNAQRVKLMDEERLTDMERYDLKCFAPPAVMKERERRIEKNWKRLNNCETPIWVDPRTTSELRTE